MSSSLRPPPPTLLHPLSLHDALPIYLPPSARPGRDARPGGAGALAAPRVGVAARLLRRRRARRARALDGGGRGVRSEEHTSELQSLTNLVCRLLLVKKKK